MQITIPASNQFFKVYDEAELRAMHQQAEDAVAAGARINERLSYPVDATVANVDASIAASEADMSEMNSEMDALDNTDYSD